MRRVISVLYPGVPHCPLREVGQPRPRHTPALQVVKRENTIKTQNSP